MLVAQLVELLIPSGVQGNLIMAREWRSRVRVPPSMVGEYDENHHRMGSAHIRGGRVPPPRTINL